MLDPDPNWDQYGSETLANSLSLNEETVRVLEFCLIDISFMCVSVEEWIPCPLRSDSLACICGLRLNCRVSFIHHVNWYVPYC